MFDHTSSHKGIDPCKFCNSSNTVVRHVKNRNDGRRGTMYAVQCLHCYARGPISKDPEDRNPDVAIARAIELWNK